MFKLNDVTFTEENKNYFSNPNCLAQDFIKVIKSISYREKKLHDCINDIKYNQVLHVIKIFLEKEKYIASYEELQNFNKFMKVYLGSKLTVTEQIIDEIILLVFFNIEKKNKANLKQVLLKKINLRIKKINDFIKKEVYFEKRRKKAEKLEIENLRRLITQEQYSEIKQVYYDFEINYQYYAEFLGKRYTYILHPKAFINYCDIFNNDFLNKNENILKNIKLYQPIIELKGLLEELVYVMNIRFLSTDKLPAPSYYLQGVEEDAYIEISVINYENSASHHGGKKFAHLCIGKSPIYSLKQMEMNEKFKNKQILQKIVWKDPLWLELKTYNDSFICNIEADNIFFLKSDFNEKQNKYDIEFLECCEYEFEERLYIKTYANFNEVKVDGEKLKGFFLFKTDKDCYETHILSNDVIIMKLKFFIDRFEIFNYIDNAKIVKTYEELLTP